MDATIRRRPPEILRPVDVWQDWRFGIFVLQISDRDENHDLFRAIINILNCQVETWIYKNVGPTQRLSSSSVSIINSLGDITRYLVVHSYIQLPVPF